MNSQGNALRNEDRGNENQNTKEDSAEIQLSKIS